MKGIIEPVAAAIVGTIIAAVIIYGSVAGVLTGGAQVNNTSVFNRSFGYSGPAQKPSVFFGQIEEEYVLNAFTTQLDADPNMFTEPNNMRIMGVSIDNNYKVSKNVVLTLFSSNDFIKRDYFDNTKNYKLAEQSITLPVGGTQMIWTDNELFRFTQSEEHAKSFRVYHNCTSNTTFIIQPEPDELDKTNNEGTVGAPFCTLPPADMSVETATYNPNTNSVAVHVRNRYHNQNTVLYVKAIDTLGNNVTLCEIPVLYNVRYDPEITTWYDEDGEGNLRSLQYIDQDEDVLTLEPGEAVDPAQVKTFGPNILTKHECELGSYRFTPCDPSLEGKVFADIATIKIIDPDTMQPALIPTSQGEMFIENDINLTNDNLTILATGQNLFGNGEDKTYCVENTDLSIKKVIWHRSLYQPISFSIQVESRGTPKPHEVIVQLEMYNQTGAGYDGAEPIKIPCHEVMGARQELTTEINGYPNIQDLEVDYTPNTYLEGEYYTINTYSCVAPWENLERNEVTEAAEGIYDYPLSITSGALDYVITSPFELTDQCDNEQSQQLFRASVDVLDYPEMGSGFQTESNPSDNVYTNTSNKYCLTSPLNVGKLAELQITNYGEPAELKASIQNLISWDVEAQVTLYANTSKAHTIQKICPAVLSVPALTTKEYICYHSTYTLFMNDTQDINFTIHRVPDPTEQISPFEYDLTDNSMTIPWIIGDNIKTTSFDYEPNPKIILDATFKNAGPEPTENVMTSFQSEVLKPGAHVFEDRVLYDNHEQWVENHWAGSNPITISYETSPKKQGSGSIKISGTNSRGFFGRPVESPTGKAGLGVWVYVPSTDNNVRVMGLGYRRTPEWEGDDGYRRTSTAFDFNNQLDQWVYLYDDIVDNDITEITIYYFANTAEEEASKINLNVGGAKLVSHEKSGGYYNLKMCENQLQFPGTWIDAEEKSTAEGTEKQVVCDTDYVEASGTTQSLKVMSETLPYEGYTLDNSLTLNKPKFMKNQELIAYQIKDISPTDVEDPLNIFYKQEIINCSWAFFGVNTLKTLQLKVINEGRSQIQETIELKIPKCDLTGDYTVKIPATLELGWWEANVAFCAGPSSNPTKLTVPPQSNENTEDNTKTVPLGICMNSERGALCTRIGDSVSCTGIVEDLASPSLDINVPEVTYLKQIPLSVRSTDLGNEELGGPIGTRDVYYSAGNDCETEFNNPQLMTLTNPGTISEDGEYTAVFTGTADTKICFKTTDKAEHSAIAYGDFRIVSSCNELGADQTRCSYYSSGTSTCNWCIAGTCNEEKRLADNPQDACKDECTYSCQTGSCGAECSASTLAQNCVNTAICNTEGQYLTRTAHSCTDCECVYSSWVHTGTDSDGNGYDDVCEDVSKCEADCDAIGCINRPDSVLCTPSCPDICSSETCSQDPIGSDYRCCTTNCVYDDICRETGSTAYPGHYCDGTGWQGLKEEGDACSHTWECNNQKCYTGFSAYGEGREVAPEELGECRRNDGETCTKGTECGSGVCVKKVIENFQAFEQTCESNSLNDVTFRDPFLDLFFQMFGGELFCSEGDYIQDENHVVSSYAKCIEKIETTTLKDSYGNLVCTPPTSSNLAYEDRECMTGTSLYGFSIWDSYYLGGTCEDYEARCYNTQTDPGVCGGTIDCTGLSNVDQVECVGGACSVTSCDTNYIECNNACVTPTCSSASNCGTNEACYNSGTCDSYCDCQSTYIRCGGSCVKPTCNSASDCGGTGWVCNNPGTCTASCSCNTNNGYISCGTSCRLPACTEGNSGTGSCTASNTHCNPCVGCVCDSGYISCSGACVTPVCSSSANCPASTCRCVSDRILGNNFACSNPGTCYASCITTKCPKETCGPVTVI